ncbi:MAG TPA: GNAT family N-acetyltransferase [candidate division Zixibacteria bacterium]|nr:GNAT family N-acetyltransferase [candidate division Zixibacteria bacterium]
MKIIEYTKDMREKWEAFVPDTNNGTLFHLQNFLEYHPEGRWETRHLVFEHRGKWVGVLPGATRERDGKRIHVSHPGASFGGIAVAPTVGIEGAHRMVELWTDWARRNDYEGVEFTRVPTIYHAMPEEHADFALMRMGAFFVKRELTAVLRLGPTEEASFARFRPEARTSARKAKKLGVTVDFDADIPAFYSILEANLGARHNVKPTHSLDELLDLKRRFPDKIHQMTALADGEPVAGVSLWEVTPRAVIAFYISHRQSAQKLRPLNLLFWEIFRWCIGRGFEWFDFGTYTLNMEPNFGLARFKEGFGAKGIFRDTLRLVF